MTLHLIPPEPSSPEVARLTSWINAIPQLREHVIATLADDWANRSWDESDMHEFALSGFRGYANLSALELAETLVAEYAEVGGDWPADMILAAIGWEGGVPAP